MSIQYLDYDGAAELVDQLKAYVAAYADAKAGDAGSSGSSDDFDALVMRAITEVADDDGSITGVGSYTFYGCSSLTAVDLPACTSIGSSAFRSCTSLASVDLPVCTSIGNYAFYGCTSLASADLPVCTDIGNYAFYGCTSLASLTLGADEVCTLSSTTALTGTAIADGEGYIYVPADLVDSYKSASKWSTYADQITAIEE